VKLLLVYSIVGLATVVSQTTLLRLPLFHNAFFDLLIPLVVFWGLRLRDGRGVTLVIVLGLVMDLVSGGIFGLYLSTYFWIFLSVKNVSKYFDVDDTVFQSVLIAACVLWQHLLFCITLSPPWKGAQLLAVQAIPVLMQIMLAALTGPSIFILLRKLQTRFYVPPPSAQKEKADSVIR